MKVHVCCQKCGLTVAMVPFAALIVSANCTLIAHGFCTRTLQSQPAPLHEPQQQVQV